MTTLISLSPKLCERKEAVFIIIAGIFIGTLGIINILGLSRFVDLSFSCGYFTIPMILPLGVLPYPITFLCTDIISEFYGKKRANLVVWVGFIVNLWIVFILWIGGIFEPHVLLDPHTHLPFPTHPEYAFFRIRVLTMGSVLASLIAYLAAQLLDVYLFHFWKDLTKGKHLWLRNNASTLVSQFVDTVIVFSITFLCTDGLPLAKDKPLFSQLSHLILCSYTFKAIAALLDTIPFYLTVFSLRHYFCEKKNLSLMENKRLCSNPVEMEVTSLHS